MQTLIDEHRRVQEELSDPAVHADAARAKRVNRRYAELSRIVAAHEAWIAAADAHDLDKVFLVAPSSTDERIAMTTAACRGFVYATAVMGVTGVRTTTSDLTGPLVARTRALMPPGSDLPVGVGLGVSNGDQAAEVARHADGVIVGSAFVRTILDHPGDEAAGLAALRALTVDLAEGVRRG